MLSSGSSRGVRASLFRMFGKTGGGGGGVQGLGNGALEADSKDIEQEGGRHEEEGRAPSDLKIPRLTDDAKGGGGGSGGRFLQHVEPPKYE